MAAAAKRSQNDERLASEMMAGDPHRGRNLIPYYGCPACHTIPGIAGAQGFVGPSLAGVRDRVYIAGVLPNDPDNLVRWIRNPKQVSPKTDMPDMSIPESDARHIAAYLLTLR